MTCALLIGIVLLISCCVFFFFYVVKFVFFLLLSVGMLQWCFMILLSGIGEEAFESKSQSEER